MDPYRHCQNAAAPPGSGLYYATRQLPASAARILIALEAVVLEIERIRASCSELSVARVKLQWWREEIQRLGNGEPRHPVTRTLYANRLATREVQNVLQQLTAAVDASLGRSGPATEAELLDYARCTRGAVYALAAAAIAGEHTAATVFATDIGIGRQLTRLLRNSGRHAGNKTLPVPASDLATYGISGHAVFTHATTTDTRALFAHQAARARQRFTTALQQRPRPTRGFYRALLTLAYMDLALLNEIERDDYQVLRERPSLTPLRKLLIATRCRFR